MSLPIMLPLQSNHKETRAGENRTTETTSEKDTNDKIRVRQKPEDPLQWGF